MARLTGTGLLADGLYLLAHDDTSGRPCLHARALGVGLAGALLAELMLDGMVTVRGGGLIVTARAAPKDQLACNLLAGLVNEPGCLPVRDWLAFLAPRAAGSVARRLAADGYLAHVPSRRPWKAGRWMPVDADSAFAPVIRVRSVLEARPATVPDVVLAGLAAASGLSARLLPYGPPDGRRHLSDAVLRLSPQLRELLAQTQASVDGALLSHRV